MNEKSCVFEEKEPIKKEGKNKYINLKEKEHILDKILGINSSFEINLKFFLKRIMQKSVVFQNYHY